MQTQRAERRTIDPAQKLAWGKEFVEGVLGRALAAKQFGLVESQLDTYARAYKISAGLHDYDPTNSIDQKAQNILDRLDGKPMLARGRGKARTAAQRRKLERDRERHAQRRREDREAREALKALAGSNGAGRHLALVPNEAKLVAQIETLQEHVSDLEGQLERAMAECHTLQKILMTVGTTL